MTSFPQALLGVETDVYLGSWTDVSTYVYQRAPISIGRGRPSTSTQITPSSCTLTLNNRDSRFSVNNPVGAYYGTLVRNAPFRVSVPNSIIGGSTYLRLEDDAVSYASCPAASRIELTGSLDIRVDVDIRGYGPLVLASVWQASSGVNQRSWALLLSPAGKVVLYFTTGGNYVPLNSALSPAATPLPLGRIVIRATLDATTGLVAFYTAPAGQIDGSTWTQLGPTGYNYTPTAVTLFSSTTAPLTVGYSPGLGFDAPNAPYENAWLGTTGSVYDFELRNGIGGTIVAKGAFSAQSAGATTWTDSPGNTWSLTGTATLSNRLYRYHGELAELPKAADTSGNDIYSQAVASGVLRRIQQSQTPLRSAFYRAVQTLSIGPAVAYWPCEDASGATQIASGLSGGTAASFTGTPQFAANTTFKCAAALPSLSGSTWTAAPPTSGITWTDNMVRFLMLLPAAGETDGTVVASLYTAGTLARVDVVYNTASGGELNLNMYSSSNVLLASAGPVLFAPPVGSTIGGNGVSAMVDLEITPSGGNVQAQLNTLMVGSSSSVGSFNTVTGSVGALTKIVINPAGGLVNTVIGHIYASNTIASVFNLTNPLQAWTGENAGARVQRLCTEEGVQARIYGHPGLSAAMGAQGVDTLMNLLQACETVDRGMLFEPRTCLGVGYRTLTSLYNQSAIASANYASAQVAGGFGSTMDDLLTLNDVTVTNTDGSSARQVLSTGAMSILAPPNGVGRVDTTTPVNASSDSQLASIANWILHVSTTSYDRVPTVPFDLARSETPFAVASLDIGDMVAVTNPPSWIQYDEIDQLCAGFTENLGPMGIWTISVNGLPAPPYTIAQVSGAGGNAVRLDTDGSTLTTGVSSTATSMSVTTATGFPVWTQNAGDMPFDIKMAGERMTVTNITGASSPQTFTVTRSVNGVVKSQTAGAALSLWYPATVGI